MSFTTDYGVFLGNIVYKGFNHFTTEAMATQEKTLQKIMKKTRIASSAKSIILKISTPCANIRTRCPSPRLKTICP